MTVAADELHVLLDFDTAADPARIRSLGFMISDRQAGPFHLEIDWIAWR